MTLPTLITNNRNKQLETSLKKAYSVIGQALNMYQAENGERITYENTTAWQVKPLLMNYLKTVRDCKFGTEQDDACIPHSISDQNKSSTVYKTYNGTSVIDLVYFDDGQFVLNDGMLVLIENNTRDGKNLRMYISVDVNGFNKKPNRLGQDLFMFQIDKKGALLPMGAEGTDYYSETDEYCSSTSSNNLNGIGCTYKALTEKDYFNKLPK